MIGIVWPYRFFYDDDCDEEEEPQEQTETRPRTSQSHGRDTVQAVLGSSSESHHAAMRQKHAPKESSALLSKNPESCPALANDVAVHPLVPYPVSSPTKQEVESLEALLASVPPQMDISSYGMVPLKVEKATQTDPVPSQTEPPLSPTAREVICPFHPTFEL